MPLYPLYALWFADSGLSSTDISALFIIWSAVGLIAEVPSGALADRFGRRRALVAAGVLQSSGYLSWVLVPGFGSFAAGFVLWGFAGALASGTFRALLYDGLTSSGAAERYPRISGWASAAELLGQLPAAAAAALLYPLGGYELVGWCSVITCLAAAVLAGRLPDTTQERGNKAEPGYLDTLRGGLRELSGPSALRGAALAYALLAGLEALEEYFGLLARGWGVPTGVVPLVIWLIPVTGAAASALAGRAAAWRRGTLAAVFVAGVLALGLACVFRHPAGLAGVAVFYGLYRLVCVVLDARLQERVHVGARATVTSVAEFGGGIAGIACYATWAAGGLPLVLGLCALLAATLPRLLPAAE